MRLALAALAVIALVAWLRERRRAARLEGRDREQLDRANQRLELAERMRETAREWRRELEGAIDHHERAGGTLGVVDDVPRLVLVTAIRLLDADRGLLLTHGPDDEIRGVVAAEGFENDPADSAVARRFAEEVIEQGTIVRAEGTELDQARRTAADEEIENLVAIPIYVRDEFNGVVVGVNSDSFDEHDEEVLVALGDHAGAILHNTELHGRLRGAYLSTVRMLAEAIRAKDALTGGHSEQVSAYVERVARRLELEPERRERLVFASLLHDLGKIGISERILLKPGSLSPEERTIVQLHPRVGCRLVDQIAELAALGPLILHHHERFDGGGYPSGLRGEEIPLESRVICVADAFSAMTSNRPYRRRLALADACGELERNAGGQFDPEVVRLFLEEVRRDPPADDAGPDPVSRALADPELELRRRGEEPVLGGGPLEITDQLTLLYSHRYLHELARSEAERAAVQGSPFAVALIALSNIGAINRERGYAAGDRAIQSLARALERTAERCHGTAARYSGRCLAMLVPSPDGDRLLQLAANLREELGDGLVLAVGIATWQPGEQAEQTIARARRELSGVREPSIELAPG